jgi:hypothetical protein
MLYASQKIVVMTNVVKKAGTDCMNGLSSTGVHPS